MSPCYVWKFLSLPHSNDEILMPNVMALGGGAFERGLTHEGRTPMNEINAFVNNTQEGSLPLPLCADTMRSLQPKRQPSPDHVGTLTPDLQPPELWEMTFCCL